MPITVKVQADTRKVRATLVEIEKQLPFATAKAINDLAFQVQRAERAAIATTFNNPRPFTVKSVLVNKANKASLSATISIKPDVAKYLAPYESGGMHVLPGRGIALLTPKNVGLDQYGQLRRGTTQRLKNRPDVFVGPVQTAAGVVSGFWQRLKAKAGQPRLKLLIRFSDNEEVTKSLGFEKRAESLIAAGFSAAFASAMAKALETATK